MLRLLVFGLNLAGLTCLKLNTLAKIGYEVEQRMRQTIAKVSWIQKIRRISAGIVWWATTLRICRLGVFQDAFFCTRDVQHSKWTSGGMVCVLAQRTMETIWWIGKRQTAVHVAVRNPRLFPLVLVHERMALLLRHLGKCGSETISHKSKGDLGASETRAT